MTLLFVILLSPGEKVISSESGEKYGWTDQAPFYKRKVQIVLNKCQWILITPEEVLLWIMCSFFWPEVTVKVKRVNDRFVSYT